MAADSLILRDIHQPPSPPWWPPAPGWWLVAAAVLAVIAVVIVLRARRARRRREIAHWFDRTVDAAGSPAQQVAAMSDLLRRSARRRDAQADRFQGDAWLAFLDGHPRATGAPAKRASRAAVATTAFTQGAGRLLLDGGFRRDVDPAEVDALRPVARTRFLQWMGAA